METDEKNYLSKIKKYLLKIKVAYKSLSPEKVLIVWSLFALSIVLMFSALIIVNNRFVKVIPKLGGSISEGMIGTPRFINPVLATSDQDNSLTALIFAGLTKRDESGNIILDMAESIDESDDKLNYDIVIKKDAQFHDGVKLTADDVIYTISLIQNSLIKSPHRLEWEGVTLEKKNDNEILFSLKKPYPLFMNVLTIGILPKHIWKNLTEEQFSLSEYNIKAIGSGPFMISSIQNNSGIPTSFKLVSNKYYTLGRPYLDEIDIRTYQNEKYLMQALKDGEVSRIYGISPEKFETLKISTSTIKTSLLPKTITIFFNSNKVEALSDKKIRQALNMAINKDEIVQTVLKGYGKTVDGPFPFDEGDVSNVYNVDQAKELLSESKYSKKASSTLSLTLSTVNTDELKKVADMIKTDWEKIGVTTTILVYEPSDLNQSVIKDRDYQTLLYGTLTETPSDLYAFWHSSQRNYPGLNISNYVSNKLDTELETLKNDNDPLIRIDAYDKAKEEFKDEVPGIFLYAPDLIYIANDKVVTPLPKFSLDNSSRFDLVEKWYARTEKVWPKTYYRPLIDLLEKIIH